MAFSADDFLDKLMDIAAKVERMRDDVAKMTDEMRALRERVARLEAVQQADAEAERVATLHISSAMPDPVRVERQRPEANMNKHGRGPRATSHPRP